MKFHIPHTFKQYEAPLLKALVTRLGEGAFARVDASTVRRVRNVGEEDAIYLCAGGKDGYVGRDGRMPEGDERVSATGGPPGAVGAGPIDRA